MKLFTVAIAMIAVVSAGCREDCQDEHSKCLTGCKVGNVNCVQMCKRDYDKCYHGCASV